MTDLSPAEAAAIAGYDLIRGRNTVMPAWESLEPADKLFFERLIIVTRAAWDQQEIINKSVEADRALAQYIGGSQHEEDTVSRNT